MRKDGFRLTRIDRYIIRKFLGTYIFTILLVIAITVVFDFNEKIDYFIGPKSMATMHGIIFNYYVLKIGRASCRERV